MLDDGGDGRARMRFKAYVRVRPVQGDAPNGIVQPEYRIVYVKDPSKGATSEFVFDRVSFLSAWLSAHLCAACMRVWSLQQMAAAQCPSLHSLARFETTAMAAAQNTIAISAATSWGNGLSVPERGSSRHAWRRCIGPPACRRISATACALQGALQNPVVQRSTSTLASNFIWSRAGQHRP